MIVMMIMTETRLNLLLHMQQPVVNIMRIPLGHRTPGYRKKKKTNFNKNKNKLYWKPINVLMSFLINITLRKPVYDIWLIIRLDVKHLTLALNNALSHSFTNFDVIRSSYEEKRGHLCLGTSQFLVL
jgi:hypothetical protein